MKKAFGADSSAWRCWVIDDGKQLLGHVCVQLFEKMPNPVNEPEAHAYLTNFYVVPEMRGRGLGRKLLNKALSWCRAQGADAVILWATAESKSLYRRCGLLEPADILELRGDSSSAAQLSAQRLGEPDQFVCQSFDAPDNFLVGDVVAVETLTGGEHKPGNNHATKIQH